MSVHFVSGKPGGGKTLFAMRLLIDELRRGPVRGRHIVTNVAVNFEGLAVYCEKESIDLGGIHLKDRITILDEENLRQFYLFRPGWRGVVQTVRGGPQDGAEYVDFSGVRDNGVLYILDEIHIAFNSRAWQTTGRCVIYYLSQHRKLGDEVLLITQSVNNVDRQMRSIAQDFSYVRNLKKERSGFFGMPGIFMRRTFLEPAGPTTRAIESKTFTLDVAGIATCYDTAAGVGIIGRSGADMAEKGKGLPWWLYPVLVVALILIVVKTGPGIVEAAVRPKHTPRPAPMSQTNTAEKGGIQIPPEQSKRVLEAPRGQEMAKNGTNGPLVRKVTGWGYVDANTMRVMWSDGSSSMMRRVEGRWQHFNVGEVPP